MRGHSGFWNFVDKNWLNNRQTPRLHTHTRLGSTYLSRRGEGSQSRLMWRHQRLRLKGCTECMCVFGGGALSVLPIRVWDYRCVFMRVPTWRWAFLLFFKSLFTFVHWHRKTPISDGSLSSTAGRCVPVSCHKCSAELTGHLMETRFSGEHGCPTDHNVQTAAGWSEMSRSVGELQVNNMQSYKEALNISAAENKKSSWGYRRKN